MKKKLSLLLSLFLGIVYCFCGCQTEKLRFEYEQLTSDFIKAELIYETEIAYPLVYETRYILTESESVQLLRDISQMTFWIAYGRPNHMRDNCLYSIKLSYTNRTLFFHEYSIGYSNVQGTGELLENYKEYSKYPGYDIGRNEEFMAILNYYIAKAEQQN